jgi:MFS family permease
MSAAPAAAGTPAEHRQLIAACGLGTLFEWYDFYLYGVLAPVLARQFFAALDADAALVATLVGFAIGFVVRPLGALVFGRLGDLIGRKYTFLATLLLMGAATFLIGLLPGEAAIGVAAPVALIVLRLAQGLAIGGEYGGVATYVAEHAPSGRRGAYTGWIQCTATAGLLLALLVIAGTRELLGEEKFAAWGWRIPFLLSALLLAISVWIRLRLKESPAFRRIKQSGRSSRAPLAEAFGNRANLKQVLLALFGLAAGQGVVWYAGQYHVLVFLTLQLRVDEATASLLVAVALAVCLPAFVAFGALSDRIGRKPVIVAGCLCAAVSYFALFDALTRAANPALAEAQARVPVTLNGGDCTLQLSPLAGGADDTACDAARRVLVARSVRYALEEAPGAARVAVGERSVEFPAGVDAAARNALHAALDAAGYPREADPARIDRSKVLGILVLLVLFAAMVYGPIAAALVEMFPTRVRCSSVSLPYHIGNGWFGGLLPATSIAIGAHTGRMLDGLWYPVAVAAAGALIALLFLRETKDRDIYAGD